MLRDLPTSGLLRSLRASSPGAWAMPWNLIGQPAVSIPAGLDTAGMPIAVQLCGRANDESTLLRLSQQIERARPWAANVPTAIAEH